MADRDTLRDIWNRACSEEGTGVEDRHLGALLLVDGMIQNGGPNHAADVCEPAELAAAAAGARYFGLEDVAACIEEMPAAASDEDAEERLNDLYFRILPDAGRFEDALAARYAAAPGDFEPVSPPG